MSQGGDPSRIEVLAPAECLELLKYNSFVGRVGFVVESGRPMVLPVNYLFDKESIVFCTAPGTKLSHLSHGEPVAFEVDASRSLYNSGWSVLVRGTAREVTDARELELLRRGPLRSWGVSPSEHWIRISIDEISGRRIPET